MPVDKKNVFNTLVELIRQTDGDVKSKMVKLDDLIDRDNKSDKDNIFKFARKILLHLKDRKVISYEDTTLSPQTIKTVTITDVNKDLLNQLNIGVNKEDFQKRSLENYIKQFKFTVTSTATVPIEEADADVGSSGGESLTASGSGDQESPGAAAGDDYVVVDNNIGQQEARSSPGDQGTGTWSLLSMTGTITGIRPTTDGLGTSGDKEAQQAQLMSSMACKLKEQSKEPEGGASLGSS